MNINQLSFFSKSNSGNGTSDKDIGITLYKGDCVGFTIRNKCENKIAEHGINNIPSQYVLVAFCDGRLYFKGTHNRSGFKIGKSNKSQNKYFRIPLRHVTEDFKEWVLNNEGQYDLRFDEEAGLYYVSNGMQFMSKGGII